MNDLQKRAVDCGVDLARLPKHLACIMDGNGRWAQNNGQERVAGHWEGYRTLKNALLNADQLGIEVLTVYGFSAENWKRPQAEVDALMDLIAQAAETELMSLVEQNVRARIAGRLSELPEHTRCALANLEEKTKHNTGIVFVLAINYGGRAEIIDAVKKHVAQGGDVNTMSEQDISRNLYCSDLPEPDLLIRTAGEYRWSNFLIWQGAYAELFVSEKTWPEFDENTLIDAVLAYQGRVRKFGGL